VTERSHLSVVRSSVETQEHALSALRLVSDEYGLPALKKPCIAFLLDGNIGGAERHEAAFIIAIECRACGLTANETERVLVRWANKIGYRERTACRAINNAYAKNAAGGWRYFPPGLVKRPNTVAFRVLAPICTDVGCPQNCPAYQNVSRGPRGESFRRFEQLRWPQALRQEHRGGGASIDFYRAICELEDERGFAPGVPLMTSSAQLARLAGRDRRHAMDNLHILFTRGLLRRFERGSGSGPKAHDRLPTVVAREVPIPSPPPRLLISPQLETGGHSPPQIEGHSHPQIEGHSHPDIGGDS